MLTREAVGANFSVFDLTRPGIRTPDVRELWVGEWRCCLLWIDG